MLQSILAVGHLWETLFAEVVTEKSYSHHKHVNASATVSRSESAGIPHRNNHIGSVRMNADGSLANKWETVKQLSMLSKVPASMAPNQLPHWSPMRSNGSQSDQYLNMVPLFRVHT